MPPFDPNDPNNPNNAPNPDTANAAGDPSIPGTGGAPQPAAGRYQMALQNALKGAANAVKPQGVSPLSIPGANLVKQPPQNSPGGGLPGQLGRLVGGGIGGALRPQPGNAAIPSAGAPPSGPIQAIPGNFGAQAAPGIGGVGAAGADVGGDAADIASSFPAAARGVRVIPRMADGGAVAGGGDATTAAPTSINMPQSAGGNNGAGPQTYQNMGYSPRYQTQNFARPQAGPPPNGGFNGPQSFARPAAPVGQPAQGGFGGPQRPQWGPGGGGGNQWHPQGAPQPPVGGPGMGPGPYRPVGAAPPPQGPPQASQMAPMNFGPPQTAGGNAPGAGPQQYQAPAASPLPINPSMAPMNGSGGTVGAGAYAPLGGGAGKPPGMAGGGLVQAPGLANIPTGQPGSVPQAANTGMRRYTPIGAPNPAVHLGPKPEDMAHHLPTKVRITPRMNVRLPRPKIGGVGGIASR